MGREWDELRKEARIIEGDLDVRLSSCAKLGGTLSLSLLCRTCSDFLFFFFCLTNLDRSPSFLSPASGYSDSRISTESNGRDVQWKSVEVEIESLLEKLLDINDAMGRCASAAVPTTSIAQKLTRHQDILHEFTQVAALFFFSLARCSQCSSPSVRPFAANLLADGNLTSE